ncbi:MAG: class IV adenylate cyclase [Haloarculaceae archaeon]
MYEVEVKVRAEHAPVERALDAAGAAFLGSVTQEDTYYDAPHRDFAATDEALRIRRERAGEPADAGGESGADTGGDDRDSGDGTGVEGKEGGGNEGDSGDEGGDETTRVTYKGPLLEAESKSREEHETAVADGEAAAGILDGLGFEPAATVRKDRRRYRLDGYTVTLDSVDGLGEFVEVETETDDEDFEAAREGAIAVLEALGLDPDDQIRTSYLGLLLGDNSE